MKILKGMSRLVLVLVGLASTTAASAEGNRYWAFADALALYDNEDWYKYPYAYGAAWNYPSLEEAGEAAVKECRKHASDPQGCGVSRTGENSCFGIIKVLGRHPKYAMNPNDVRFGGTYTWFNPTWGYHSRVEAEAGTKQYAAEMAGKRMTVSSTFEMVACAGVE